MTLGTAHTQVGSEPATGTVAGAHHAVVITSEKYARSEWGASAEWCDACNGWVSR